VKPLPRRQLDGLRLLSLVDGLLLVALVYSALTHDEAAVDVLGPTHGVLFLVLVGSLVVLKSRGWWSWWFVAAVVVLGPLASIPGLERVRLRQSALS